MESVQKSYMDKLQRKDLEISKLKKVGHSLSSTACSVSLIGNDRAYGISYVTTESVIVRSMSLSDQESMKKKET